MQNKETISAIQEIHQYLENAQKITIFTHENPDGDSLGSALALYHYLTSKGKSVQYFVPNQYPETYSFLPGINFVNIFDETNTGSIKDTELIFILDVNSPSRLGKIGELLPSLKCKKIMIDHHINPTIDVDIAYINTKASATGELIYNLINSDSSFSLNQSIAESIYTAILTDTGGFRHDSTTVESHLIAAELMKHGINVNEIYNKIYNQMPLNVLRILGRAFSSSNLYLDGRLNVMYVTESDMDELNISPEELNNFAEETLTAKGSVAGIFISRHSSKNYYKISFRSRGNINIRSIAEMYGGGGHFNAAGGKEYNLDLPSLIEKLVGQVDRLLDH